MGNVLSGKSDNEMKKLLEKCEKLSKWVKERIQKNYDGDWGIAGDGNLYLIRNRKSDKGKEKITDEMIPELLQCIELFGDRVKTLNLQANKITSKGAILLFEGLKQMKSRITTIYLYRNQLDDECMRSLGEFIQNSNTIESIGVQYNKIKDKGIEILSPYLEGNTTLKTLDLFSNKGITDKSVPNLIDVAKKSAIASLNIHYTSISDEKKGEINTLATVNEIKSGCDEIDLNSSFITDKGIEILYPYLEGNTTLKTLCLYGNKEITDKSVPNVIDIAKKSAITSLDIRDTSISSANKEEIEKLVRVPIDEREIPIQSSSKSAAKTS